MVSKAEREYVTERARSRCEYCRAPQVVTGVTFHVEHIVPQTRGGLNESSNYALCCVTCNGHKSDHVTGFDKQTGEQFRLFILARTAGRAIFDLYRKPLRYEAARQRAAPRSTGSR